MLVVQDKSNTQNLMNRLWKGFVKNTPRQRKKVVGYLNQLILEGATDLATAVNDNQYDLFLLSDGAVTWGEKDAFFISESVKKLATGNKSINQLYTYRLGLSGENAAMLTQGYGLEMYVNKKALKGKYDLLVKYFSSDRNKLGLKTKALVRTIRNWGTDEESEQIQTVTLNSQAEKQRIAKIRI